ncbi:peroxiredoxin family protein [Salmonirosea aquatica]|uniref:Thioredoxin domain-containing protein n=1 Tax=Salmonirosea aquatica TaxID=2654236 RepID=A0A7C9FPL9_9BACT|nr:hypothetical protein [Cytophagaceae bacterium SJW1-29]
MISRGSFLILLLLFYGLAHTAVAQSSLQRSTRRISSQGTIDRNTKIYDKETGMQIPFEEFSRMFEGGSKEYSAIPQIDEYGQVSFYVVRKKTKEELELGQANLLNDYKKPEVGQVLSPFVMQGADDQTYSSSQLRGSYILLSFWQNLEPPFFSADSAKDLVELIGIAKAKHIKLVSLGITMSSMPEGYAAMNEFKLGFVPIPEARNFMIKYGLSISPSYLLIGPEGTLLALIENNSPLPLQKYLRK